MSAAAPAQHIEIKASGMLALALCVVHGAAAAVIWLAPVPLWLKAAIALAIAASLVHALSRNAALHAEGSIVALEITEAGRLSVRTRAGEWQACELLGSSYVSPSLTILNLESPGARVRHVVLVPDNVAAQDFRRLRTWLRWAAYRAPGDREIGRWGER